MLTRDVFLNSIDFKSGSITYNDFDIDPMVPFFQQELSLQEDLLQVCYGSYVVDVGWYPAINPSGRFVIYLIRNSNWRNPIRKVEAKNLAILKKRLQEVIDYAEALVSQVHI